MKESIFLQTSRYAEKPKKVKRVVFNRIDILGLTVGQFRHKHIKTCIKSNHRKTPGCSWIEISPSSPLLFEYMKEQANEQI